MVHKKAKLVADKQIDKPASTLRIAKYCKVMEAGTGGARNGAVLISDGRCIQVQKWRYITCMFRTPCTSGLAWVHDLND
jgi:hypothetical protein